MSYKRVLQSMMPHSYFRFAGNNLNEGLISSFGQRADSNAILSGSYVPTLISGDPYDQALSGGGYFPVSWNGLSNSRWNFRTDNSGQDSWAYAFWIKSSSSAQLDLVWAGSSSTPTTKLYSYTLRQNAAGNLYFYNIQDTTSYTATSAVINDNQRHFVVVNHWRGSRTQIWIDGQLSADYVPASNTYIHTTATPIALNLGTGVTWDEFALMPHPLEESQIQTLWNEGTNPRSTRPGRRPMPWGTKFSIDTDGTIVGIAGTFTNNTIVKNDFTLAQKQEMIDDDDTLIGSYGGPNNSDSWVLKYVFPEPRNVHAIIGHSAISVGGLRYSYDATSLNDVNWLSIGSDLLKPGTATTLPSSAADQSTDSGPISDLYAVQHWRPFKTPLYGIRGIAMYVAGSTTPNPLYTFQVYGTIPNTTNSNRVILWDPLVDSPLSNMFYGDMVRGTSRELTFRLKNISLFTANNITLTKDALTETVSGPTVNSMLTFTAPGGSTFATTQNITSMAPGEISAVITARLTVDPAMAYGTWLPRIKVSTGSFT